MFFVLVSLNTPIFIGFPGSSYGIESACSAADVVRSPGGGHGHPLQYSCLENPHGQRSLAGYGPWGRKELDTAERLSAAPHSPVCPLLLRKAPDVRHG